ncbi:hypothetical protein WJ542_04335 [Paraburkholderia sp. B3]|uniref:hypothetical protein n=1 Tax=Paraburkholderia sp. B3 TaxID=3134791 RepID=UPI00398227BC
MSGTLAAFVCCWSRALTILAGRARQLRRAARRTFSDDGIISNAALSRSMDQAGEMRAIRGMGNRQGEGLDGARQSAGKLERLAGILSPQFYKTN